jgi:hypothetical protein
MQYDQRNRMNATRALYDLVYGSYMYFKKCNATYDPPCTSCSQCYWQYVEGKLKATLQLLTKIQNPEKNQSDLQSRS